MIRTNTNMKVKRETAKAVEKKDQSVASVANERDAEVKTDQDVARKDTIAVIKKKSARVERSFQIEVLDIVKIGMKSVVIVMQLKLVIKMIEGEV